MGINWAPKNDIFMFKAEKSHKPLSTQTMTKRQLASEILRLYDPLGLIQPMIITAKIIFQQLWKFKSGWGDDIPGNLAAEWNKLKGEVPNLVQVEFPRQALPSNPHYLELHGFSDASMKAYGACIYFTHVDADGNTNTQLLCAKSIVAPIKEVSLPRLELKGALLLAELAHRVRQTFQDRISAEFYWCDSTVTLSWIKGPIERWKQYVRNRVIKIHELNRLNGDT